MSRTPVNRNIIEIERSGRPGILARDRTWILGLVLGALSARGLFLTAPRVLTNDELHYAESLFRFLHGQVLAGVSDYWSFFYPAAALPFALLTGDAEWGLRLLSVAAGSATVIFVFLIARGLWGRRPAILAGALTAFHPNLIQDSTGAMTEPLYSFFLLLAIYLFLEHLAGRSRRALVGTGLALGFAWLTRQEAQFFLLAFLAIVLVRRTDRAAGAADRSDVPEPVDRPVPVEQPEPVDRPVPVARPVLVTHPAPVARRLARAGTMLGLFVLVLLPYLSMVHAKTGRWTLGSKVGVNVLSPVIFQEGLEKEKFLYSLNAAGTARAVEESGRENVFRIVWERKTEFVSRYVSNFIEGLSILPSYLASPFLLLFVPLGLVGRRWRKEDRAAEVTLFLCGLLPWLIYSAFLIVHRYLVATTPIYLLWGGLGFSLFLDWLSENVTPRRSAAVAVIALVFLGLVPYTARKYRATASSQALESKEIGRWIARNEAPGSRLLARPGCPASYYAGNPMATYIPFTDVPGLLRFARLGSYDLLLLPENYVRELRPALAPLLDAPPADVREIRSFTDREGGRVVLYRLAQGSVPSGLENSGR